MADPHTTTRDARMNELAAPETTSAPDRRTILKGLAIAGAAAPILAGCSGSGSNSTNDGGSTTPAGGGGKLTNSAGGGGDVLVKAADVEVGGGVILPNQTIVITQPTKGTFEGFSSTCTHMGCTVTTISGGTINCPCHFSKYSITDGSVQAGPAPAPLPKKPVKDEGGNIVLA